MQPGCLHQVSEFALSFRFTNNPSLDGIDSLISLPSGETFTLEKTGGLRTLAYTCLLCFKLQLQVVLASRLFEA